MKYLSLFILFIAFLPLKTNAFSAAGAEITYAWLHDSTFQITYHLYADCIDTAKHNNDSVQICYRNTCSSVSGSLYLYPPIPGIITPPGSCMVRPTRCQSDTSTIPGYYELWFQGVITLPSKCNSWIFSRADKRAVPVGNLLSTDTMLYVEATLNNMDAANISSPYFTGRPNYLLYNNTPAAFSFGAYSNSGDSLSIESISPMTGSNCVGQQATYTIANSLPSNPFPCNNSYYLYAPAQLVYTTPIQTAYFTPSVVGTYAIAVRANTYTKVGTAWTKVGSVMRDMSFYVVPPIATIPIIKLDTASISGATLVGDTIVSCTHQALSFAFNCKTYRTHGRINVSTGFATFSGPLGITYTYLVGDSVHGIVSWRPGSADTALRIINVTIFDTVCAGSALTVASYPLKLYMRPSVAIATSPLAGVCKGGSITLHGTFGSSYTWGVLPGGSPLSSLSCTSCSDPVASPTATTNYTLSATSVNGCYNKDTLRILADTVPAKPTIKLSSYVCSNGVLVLNATHPSAAVTFRWSEPGGTFIGPYAAYPPFTAGYYKVWAADGYGCLSAADSSYVSVTQRPKGPKIIGDSALCASSPLSLTAISLDSAGHNDTMRNFIWLFSGYVITSSDSLIYKNTLSLTVWPNDYYYVYTTNRVYHCNSDTSMVRVIAYSIPPKPVLSSGPSVCPGDSLRLFATDTSSSVTSYYWSGPVGFTSSLQNPVTPSIAGKYKAWVKAINGCNSYQDSINITTLPQPSMPKASYVSPVCKGQLLYLSAGTVISGVTYHWAIPDTSLHYGVPDPTLPDPQPGIYKLWITNSYGCNSFADSVNIHITPIYKPLVSIYATPGSGSSWVLLASVINGGTAPTFQWRKNGIDIPGAITNPYTITSWRERDAYSVKVHSSAGCAIPADTIATTYPLSVTTTTSENTLYIYPNPVKTGKLFIKLKSPDEVLKITISDVYGRQVFNTDINSDNNELILPVDVSSYSSGVYIVVVKNVQNDIELNTTRFVKE